MTETVRLCYVLRHAVDGKALVSLCFATPEEAEEFKEKTHTRIRKEMQDEQNRIL